MSVNEVKFFILNGHAARSEIYETVRQLGIVETSNIDEEADRIVAEYLPQINTQIRLNASRMADFYRIFYAMEIEIRGFVADTLQGVDENWWDRLVPEPVRKNAEKLREREKNEGVTIRSSNMIEYTTFGELGEIIKQNWAIFGGVMTMGSTVAVEKIMARLNMLRGPIAHCGILNEEEALRLKLTIRDWFRLMEK
jgi:hypothetical protein